MYKQMTSAVCAGIFILGLVSMAEAALLSRLGGQAYYDTDLNITWLGDANLGAGSAFDDGISTTDGFMTWQNAVDWAASLTIGGVSGWRLPTTTQPDPTCSSQTGDVPPQGFNVGCTGSEMGHLFNVEGISAAVPGVFSNVRADGFYWSGTEFAPDPGLAWAFLFVDGDQRLFIKSEVKLAWAVRSGDVAPVPTPSAMLLFGTGIAGLIGLRGWSKKTA